MTDHAAFLAAIVAAPDDDLPRLVYADWLDEHGDPARAEFVRVGCELDRRWPPSPRVESQEMVIDGCRFVSPDDSADFYALRKRERELLEAEPAPGECNWLNWCPDVLWKIIDKPQRGPIVMLTDEFYIFTRGFVSQLTLSWQDWQAHAAALLTACPLTGKDSLVRLTTWPAVEYLTGPYDRGQFITYRFVGGKAQGRITERESVAEPWDQMRPRKTLELLAAEWPGVRFELPQSGITVDFSALTAPVTVEDVDPAGYLRPGTAFRIG